LANPSQGKTLSLQLIEAKMNFISILICAVLGLSRPVDSRSPVATIDPCSLHGMVYVEPVESFATYKVFVEDAEAFADLRVFKETVQAFADKPGHWYFTDTKAFADFTVSLVSVKAFANFSIYYTEFQTLAGCR
jgi:Family of unknown function (DUF6150)